MSFLSASEVGKVLKLSANQVRKLILAGRLRAIDAGTGDRHHWRVPESALWELENGPAEVPEAKLDSREDPERAKRNFSDPGSTR